MTKKEYETLIAAFEKLEEEIVLKFDKFNDEITKAFNPKKHTDFSHEWKNDPEKVFEVNQANQD